MVLLRKLILCREKEIFQNTFYLFDIIIGEIIVVCTFERVIEA